MSPSRIVALLGLLLAAGCTHPAASADPPAASPSPAARPLQPADVIEALREQGEFTVTGVHPMDEAPIFAMEGSEAKIGSTDIIIATFGNAAGRAAWLEMVLTLGRAGVIGTGDRPENLWGVNPTKEQDGLALADKIAQRLGGTIRPAQD